MGNSRGRRGQILDIFAILFICLGLAITAIFLSKIVSEFQTGMSGLGADSAAVLTGGQNFTKSFDTGILFIFIIGVLVAGALAYAIKSVPVAIIAVIFIGLILLVIAPIFGNIYIQTGSDAQMATTANQFTAQANFWNRIPWFAMTAIFVILLMLFGKPLLMGG